MRGSRKRKSSWRPRIEWKAEARSRLEADHGIETRRSSREVTSMRLHNDFTCRRTLGALAYLTAISNLLNSSTVFRLSANYPTFVHLRA